MASSISPEVDLWVQTSEIESIILSCALPDNATWQAWFSVWIKELMPTASPINQYEVSLLLTNDTTIQALNSNYRCQDRPTDVLAFAAQETQAPGAEIIYQTVPMPLGDLIISVETAQRQRQDTNHSLTKELAWLATHGLLHLLGWDHPDKESLREMLDQQSHLLRQVNLTV